ncbi:hypothetical protein ILUMI_16377 [Ignelater luminosus]|uniref:Uncharacterized protein n=1 Tax=Ignelater luminosus TaxID=2038154 RepID=A0A8K0CRD7_IGNLU|nr:hypothetical protein ILUMI_16377 [Ignelater luminosus]
MEHISLFPTKQTHYGTREHNYLDAELNGKIMHSLFLEKHRKYKAKYEYCNKVFRENFNLSFGRPQVDCKALSLKPKNKSLKDTAKIVAAAQSTCLECTIFEPIMQFSSCIMKAKQRKAQMSRDNGKGGIVGKDFIEGAITNTFPLLLPEVITTEMPVDLHILLAQ